MLPSSSRVKINRVAFKDVELTLVPRRRRFPKPVNNVTAQKQEENQLKDTARVQTAVTTDREKVADTIGNVSEGEPEEKQACKGEDSNCMEVALTLQWYTNGQRSNRGAKRLVKWS